MNKDDNNSTNRVLIVGLGGIGSNLLDLVVPVLSKSMQSLEIHLMDDDLVDLSNLAIKDSLNQILAYLKQKHWQQGIKNQTI